MGLKGVLGGKGQAGDCLVPNCSVFWTLCYIFVSLMSQFFVFYFNIALKRLDRFRFIAANLRFDDPDVRQKLWQSDRFAAIRYVPYIGLQRSRSDIGYQTIILVFFRLTMILREKMAT